MLRARKGVDMNNEPIFAINELDDFFIFKINEHTYQMKYPSTEDLLKSDEVNDKIRYIRDKVKKSKQSLSESDKENIKNLQDKIEHWIYTFIKPTDEKSPSIQEAIKSFSFRTQQKFYKSLYTQWYSLDIDEG